MTKSPKAINKRVIHAFALVFVINSHAIAIPEIDKLRTELLNVPEVSSYPFLISSSFIIFLCLEFLDQCLWYCFVLALAMLLFLVSRKDAVVNWTYLFMFIELLMLGILNHVLLYLEMRPPTWPHEKDFLLFALIPSLILLCQ